MNLSVEKLQVNDRFTLPWANSVHTLVAKARYLLLSFMGCASLYREVVCTAAKSRGCIFGMEVC